jgi:hypothetical protein
VYIVPHLRLLLLMLGMRFRFFVVVVGLFFDPSEWMMVDDRRFPVQKSWR